MIGDLTHCWLGTGGGVDWLALDTGGSYKLYSYTIGTNTNSDVSAEVQRAPNAWTLQGSPDGTTWTTVDTRSGETGWASGEARNYVCATSTTAYRYFRVNITANNGDATYTQIGELYLFTSSVVISPTSGAAGGVVSITATGTGTSFVNGTTTASVSGAGVTAGTVAVSSPTSLTVSLTIALGAAVTARTVTFTTGADVPAATFTIIFPPDFAPHDLTSSTSHSPYVVSASSFNSGQDPFLAFDGGSGLWYGTGGGIDWLQLDTGAGNSYLLGYYQVQAGATFANRAPQAWTMEGSNDGSSWTTLDTQTGQTSWLPVTGLGEVRTFTISSPGTTAYRYFRLNITANNGDATYTQVVELYLYGLAGSAPVVPPNTQRGNIAFDQIRGTDRTGDGNQLLAWTTTVPATSGAAGNAGQIAYDGAGNLYWCFFANAWARIGPGGFSTSW